MQLIRRGRKALYSGGARKAGGRLGGSSVWQGIVPGRQHLGRCWPSPPDALSGTRRHRMTEYRTYNEDITAQGKMLPFLPRPMYTSTAVGVVPGLIADGIITQRYLIRNKSLRSFFRTSPVLSALPFFAQHAVGCMHEVDRRRPCPGTAVADLSYAHIRSPASDRRQPCSFGTTY